MAKHLITLSANTSGNGTFVCNVNKKRDFYQYFYTIWAEGTWGSGTLTWYATQNQGTSVVAMTDLTNTAISMTANQFYNGAFSTGSHRTDQMQIWVQLAGATSPSLSVIVFDNN